MTWRTGLEVTAASMAADEDTTSEAALSEADS
jgi:hypothetical protein